MFRLEYLSSVVNMLKKSVKISDQTKADFCPTQFTSNSRENRLIVVPSSFQQCLELGNTLTTERCSEARPFRRLGNQLFRSQ